MIYYPALLATPVPRYTSYPTAADPDVRRRLAPFENAGLLRWHGTRIELTATAMPYARSVAAVFDRYRAGSAAGFSRAV